jgi:hypothetical protein
MASKAVRIFVCQLTNTAILALLIKSTFGPFKNTPGTHYTQVRAPLGGGSPSLSVGVGTTINLRFMTCCRVHYM